jgi:hypothetical protein
MRSPALRRRERECDRASGKRVALSAGRSASPGPLRRTPRLRQMRSRRVVDARGPVTPLPVPPRSLLLRPATDGPPLGSGAAAQALADAEWRASTERFAKADPGNDFDFEPMTRTRACGDEQATGRGRTLRSRRARRGLRLRSCHRTDSPPQPAAVRDQEPNHRVRRLEPKCRFSVTRAADGGLNLPVREGPDRKSMSTLATRPLPNSM